MKIKEIIKLSKKTNHFTIISNSESSILLYEGKTVMAGRYEYLLAGHEDYTFQGVKVKFKWNSLKELQKNIDKKFKLKSSCEVFYFHGEIYRYLDQYL